MSPAAARQRVVVAGGGVAGLEATLALRALAGDRVAITLLAPQADFVYRPLSVALPFARGHVDRHSLAEIARELGVEFVKDGFERLDAEARTVNTTGGAALTYDALILATGCRARPALRKAITFWSETAPETFGDLLRDVEQGYSRRVAFVVPPGVTWPLPIYELALMTAEQVRSMGLDDVRLQIVTPEDAPLAIFGTAASQMVDDLLSAAGIEFTGGTYVEERGTEIVLRPADGTLDAERVVALPALEGLRLDGVPADAEGFVPVDPYGRVRGLKGVYAAGDGAAFPIKQGGLAAQQADVVAEMIAAAAGVDIQPRPFHPVLRGLLLTGDGERYMRSTITGGDGEGDATSRALWWPASKVAGRYLAPYLSARSNGTSAPHAGPRVTPLEALVKRPAASSSGP